METAYAFPDGISWVVGDMDVRRDEGGGSARMAKYTAQIREAPLCPKCKRPTRRSRQVVSQSIVLHSTLFDEEGRVTDEADAVVSVWWRCLRCEAAWKEA